MENIHVPVSPGEVLDKITILEIKSERMNDPEKVANVRTELTLLHSPPTRFINEDMRTAVFAALTVAAATAAAATRPPAVASAWMIFSTTGVSIHNLQTLIFLHVRDWVLRLNPVTSHG